MAITIILSQWVRKKGYEHYFIIHKESESFNRAMYNEWCTDNSKGKYDSAILRVDVKTHIVGGLHHSFRTIMLFELESDRNWFILRWT